MTQYWLMKSEPDVYSFSQLKKDKTTHWEGVRNFQARNFMKQMHKGDFVLFYHSNCDDKGVAGLARIVNEAAPDPVALDKKSDYFDPKATREKNPWVSVEVAFYRDLKHTVTLEAIKATKNLSAMTLVKKGNRLSVFPVTRDEFECIAEMGVS